MFKHSNDGCSAGLWLRQQREAAGLTQEELADRSDLSVRTIRNLELDRVRSPHPNSIRQLTRALGLPEARQSELIATYRAARAGERYAGQAAAAGFPRLFQLSVELSAGGATAVPVVVVSGPTGIAEDALALFVAHALRERFPNGPAGALP
jgi:transcriptional regulator with XRE-family HTH domain